jgi:hypothetical protein
MLTFLIDILVFAFLTKKKTPVSLVIGISAVVLTVLIVTVIKQADYVR